MSRYLVFSDSHGYDEKMFAIIDQYKKEIDGIFHLGDVEGSADRLSASIQGPVYQVRGNCDWSSKAPQTQVFKLHGHTIAMTHGHRNRVNYGVDMLKYWALENQADLVMYGHLHVPYLEQTSTLTVLNPGSISRPRQSGHVPTYAVIDFLNDGEMNIEIKEAR